MLTGTGSVWLTNADTGAGDVASGPSERTHATLRVSPMAGDVPASGPIAIAATRIDRLMIASRFTKLDIVFLDIYFFGIRSLRER